MRKITEDSIEAFYNALPFSRNNTDVVIKDDEVVLKLFNNPIITKNLITRKITIDTCGYITQTTLDRLNGLKEISIRKRKDSLILSLKLFNKVIKWDGSKIEIN